MNREQVLSIAKPILYNTPMTQAVLEDRKTATRLLVKPRSRKACGFYVVTQKTDGTVEGVYDYDENERMFDNPQPLPYYPGDILYVRESWQYVYEKEYELHGKGKDIRNMIKNFDDIPKKEMGLSRFECPMTEPARMKYCVYKASDIEYVDADNFLHWRPSIHMPKEAARIFCKVTDVRVERLQDITEEQAEQEGVLSTLGIAARTGFKTVWSSTVKKADLDKYGWDANPWVWVIEFERIEVDE